MSSGEYARFAYSSLECISRFGGIVKNVDKARRNSLPRKSKLRGMVARLAIRQDNTPSDIPGKTHYIKAGSMNRR